MNALAEVAAAGGRVWAEGDKLKYRLPKGRTDLLETLRENKPAIMAELKQRIGDEAELMRRCREACRGLPISPADLLESLNAADKQAMLSGDPDELSALRTAAECMAERAKPGLQADIERAYQHCREDLRKHPEWHKAIWTIDPDADPVLIAVAVRRVGCATLRIDRERYAGREFELLELIARVDTEGRAVPADATKEEAA